MFGFLKRRKKKHTQEDRNTEADGKSLTQYQKARKAIDALTDANLDELMNCVQGIRFETISAREFLKVLIKKHLRLLWRLRRLL